jgi:hypothetical protein
MVEGKRVRLEFNQANAVRGRKDNTSQKRILAYVFLRGWQGYGFALTRFPFSRIEEFRRLEREARELRQERKDPCQPNNRNPDSMTASAELYSIAVVVDDLIDRVMADPRLNANPAVDEAHHRVPPAGFKYLATEMVCWAAGGPQKYTGRSMADSHRHLNITPQEWEALWMTSANARQVQGAVGRAS